MTLKSGNQPRSVGSWYLDEVTLATGLTTALDTTLNDGTCGNNYGAGSQVIYSLAGFAGAHTLTDFTVFGGWKDAGRDQQAYTVSYSKVTAPRASGA